MIEKNINYYRKNLHNDSIVLLVFAGISIIVSIIFMLNDSYDLIPTFLKSIILIIMSAIIVSNRNKTKMFVGVLSIISAVIMIITSIMFQSIFDIAYIILGIIYLIHSIKYINIFKKSETYIEDKMLYNKNSKLPVWAIIIIIIGIVSILYILMAIIGTTKTVNSTLSKIKLSVYKTCEEVIKKEAKDYISQIDLSPTNIEEERIMIIPKSEITNNCSYCDGYIIVDINNNIYEAYLKCDGYKTEGFDENIYEEYKK